MEWKESAILLLGLSKARALAVEWKDSAMGVTAERVASVAVAVVAQVVAADETASVAPAAAGAKAEAFLQCSTGTRPRSILGMHHR